NERMAPAVVRRFRCIDWQRDPRTHSIVAERKAVGHDADHFTRLIIELDRRADCAEGPLGRAVTENRQAAFRPTGFLLGERPSTRRLDTEHVEESGGDARDE